LAYSSLWDLDALQAIGADGAALAAGLPTPWIVMRSARTGKQLGVSRISTSCPDGIPSHDLKRDDLYRALHDEATSVVSASSTAGGW
jgi:hypothetical protein